jgi:lipid II:glycine glycyltransferase (peptidoglycan interpeptide bridge formation enzyme)
MTYLKKFAEAKQLKLFFAYHDDELLAGSIILTNGDQAWNKDGGSTRTKANLMAPRLVQWEAMKALKKLGVKEYDLGGIPNPVNHQGSSIPGIYIFKSGFSKEYSTLMPTLELPLSARYKLWPKAEKQWLRIYNLFAHNLWW